MENTDHPPHVAALLRAVEILGSQAALAAAIGTFLKRPTVKQGTISYWITSKALLGAEWWSAIESATDGAVTRTDLRPDVFGQPLPRAETLASRHIR
jgi:DNA-binding transcriptional regulator YdaS (Cro superfamily)